MELKTQIRQLMTELGPVLDLAAVAEYEDGNAWSLALDEETEVWIDYDEANGRLILTTEVGAPTEENPYKLYETLLVYNNQWQQTGGVRMALDAPGGAVIQSFELGTEGLDIGKLARVVQNFVDVRQGWREAVTGAPDAQEDDEAPFAAPPSGGLRV